MSNDSDGIVVAIFFLLLLLLFGVRINWWQFLRVTCIVLYDGTVLQEERDKFVALRDWI